MQVHEELIGEATAYGYTDDEEILDARKTFAELNKKYKAEIAPESRGGARRSAACTSSARSGTNPAASTTSCAAAPAVRATPARAASTSRWRTT